MFETTTIETTRCVLFLVAFLAGWGAVDLLFCVARRMFQNDN